MPKKIDTVNIEFGVQNKGTNSSNRMFFFYVGRGEETGIHQCKYLIRNKTSPNNHSITNGNWCISAKYDLIKPITLKMVYSKTVFGSKKFLAHIYLNLNGNGEMIRLQGPQGFGHIIFRGEIDYDKSKSSVSDNIDEKFVEKYFYMKILAPANPIINENEGGDGTPFRNLVF